jgi:hypothetical protein
MVAVLVAPAPLSVAVIAVVMMLIVPVFAVTPVTVTANVQELPPDSVKPETVSNVEPDVTPPGVNDGQVL